MIKRVPLLLLLCLPAACVRGLDESIPQVQPVLTQARGEEENQRLYTDLIRQMVAEDQLYAALAHLQAQEQRFGTTPAVLVLRAEVLRKLGRPVEAEEMYRRVLETGQFRGQAYHGLGLIYAHQDLALGIRHLQTAAALLPTNAAIRNDLGFALLKQGKLQDARLQLATAYELKDGVALARNNYILVLLVAGDEGAARRVATTSGVSPDTMANLRRQARSLRKNGTGPDASSPPRPGTVAAQTPAIGGGGG